MYLPNISKYSRKFPYIMWCCKSSTNREGILCSTQVESKYLLHPWINSDGQFTKRKATRTNTHVTCCIRHSHQKCITDLARRIILPSVIGLSAHAGRDCGLFAGPDNVDRVQHKLFVPSLSIAHLYAEVAWRKGMNALREVRGFDITRGGVKRDK